MKTQLDSKLKTLRCCARCEYVYWSKTLNECPKCGFASYTATWVYDSAWRAIIEWLFGREYRRKDSEGG
jgi:hypothetical protein